MQRHTVVVLGVAALVALSGCGAIGLGTGPTVSDARAAVSSDGVPYLSFQYSVDDYATALLEGPDGNIISEQRLSPKKNSSGLPFQKPRPGTYVVVIEQGGETAVTKEVTFDGPTAEITNIDTKWDGSKLQETRVTVANTGDLPVQISSATVSARGQSVSNDPMYQWVGPNTTKTITISEQYGSSITIQEPGKVQGDIQLQTSNKTLSESFSKTFQGPNLEFVDANPNWSGNELRSATATVKNTGDLPTDVSTVIEHSGSRVAETDSVSLAPDGQRTFTLESYDGLYTAETAGNISMELIVDGESAYASRTIDHYVRPATVNVTSVSPVWSGNELESVTVTIENNGDLATTFVPSIQGERRDVEIWRQMKLDAGEVRELELTDIAGSLYTIKSAGNTSLDVVIDSPAGKETVTISRSVSGSDLSIDDLSTSWDSGDLTSVSFTVSNTGGIGSTVQATVSVNGEEVGTPRISVEPGETAEETLTGGYSDSVFTATTGGEYTVTVSVPGSEQSTSKSYEGVSVDVSDVVADFSDTDPFDEENNSQSTLDSVEVTIQNSGDMPLRYDTLEVVLEGSTRSDTPIYAELKPGEQETEYLVFIDGITVNDGIHDLTIRFINEGEQIVGETVTVHTDKSS